MAKVTEYPRIAKFKDNDILLVDGPDGTRTILQKDAAKQMGGEVIMVNETAGDATKVVINTTNEEVQLATMEDLEPVVGDVGSLKESIDNLPYAVYDSAYNTPNKYFDVDGNAIDQSGWSISDFLRINQTATYYIATPVYSAVVYSCFYKKDKTFLSSFKTDTIGNNVLTAPEDAEFVRFSIQTAEEDDFQYKSVLLVPYKNDAVLPNLIYKAEISETYRNRIISGSYYDGSNNAGVTNSDSWSRTPIYKVNVGDEVVIENAQGIYAVLYDDAGTIKRTLSNNNLGTRIFTIENGESQAGFNIVNRNIDGYNCTINGVPLGVKYNIPWIVTMGESVWNNKTYISHGDSITWQDGKAYTQGEHIEEIAKGYQTVFSDAVKLKSYNNQGKSGWSMAVVNGNGIVNTIMTIADYSVYNLCTIACGTNDFKLNVPIGTKGQIGDTTFDDSTFYGAYRKAVEYILTSSPTIRIVLMTPLQRDNAGYDVNYTNSAGAKLIDYVNAIKEIGEMYGLPVCDMYGNSGFTKKTLSTYTMDGLHPNDIGYKRMGGYLTQFLNGVGN